MHFVKTSTINATAAQVFAFHQQPDALERLQPPWQTVRVVQPPSSLEVGTRVVLKVKVGPFWKTVEALHVEYEAGVMFADRMERGPFKSWLHRHRVEPVDEHSCLLIDDIQYELPLGLVGRLLGGWYAHRTLERLFAFRHQVTQEACVNLPAELGAE